MSGADAVRAMYAEFTRAAETGDFASYVQRVWDPECEYLATEEYEPVRGHEALVRWNESWFEGWEEFEASPDEILEGGDAVFSAVTVRGRSREPAIDVAQQFFHVSTVRDGRLLRMAEYVDRDEALAAAGLPTGEDPVEVVRAMWDAFARNDAAATLEAFHPDVEWDGRNIPDGALGRGRQAVVDHGAHWASIWDDWTVEVEELVQATPDTVIAYTRERGRSEGGVPMDERHAEVYVVRDGMIIRRVGFSDPAEALPAVRSWPAS